ncbi:hypothetical protein AB0N17_37970 [Streptomyces sp. NPDC051133]|uniref:hypothetical protein n=1 Tax=Streptomyces sp. NPDC051133 TaxID=3155521 RepID=UPI0034370B2E
MPTADHDHFEERFADALRDAGTTFGTDRQDLAARGAAHGRRLRVRRRAAVAGGVAGVALVGLGGALVLPGGPGDHTGLRQSAAGDPAARTSTASSGTAAPAVSGEKLVRTLEKLVPEGRFSDAEGHGTDDSPAARALYDDGRGKAAVAVALGRVPAGSQEAQQATRCPDKVFIAYDACTGTKLSDGSALMILKGYEYPNRRSGTKLWTADLVTPAGQHVSVQEWNAAAEKDSPVTRDEPPLSAARLKRLITAHEWRDAFDALPAGSGTTAAPSSAPGTGHGSVPATLVRLVPHGLRVVSRSRDDDPGFGYVVVDDGRGAGLVQINVQPDMRDVEDQLFGPGTKTLPDGTKVVRRESSGEKGVSGIVMWTVDTIRPDGRRVVISAFNSGAQNTPATRSAPALTMAQLERIATDPAWLKLG